MGLKFGKGKFGPVQVLKAFAGGSGAPIPTKKYNFLNGDSPGTFTRGSGATQVNSSGTIISVGSGVARYDYDPTTLLHKGLLMETASTNSLLWGNPNTVNGWTLQNSTLVANNVASPDGTTSGSTLTDNSTNVSHWMYQGGGGTSMTAGQKAASAMFLKAGTEGVVQIAVANSSTDAWANFDLINGVVGNSANLIRASMQKFPNGWWRCQVDFAATTAKGYYSIPGFTNNNAAAGFLPSYAGVGNTFNVFGCTFELGLAESTSAILTAGSATTRAADSAHDTTAWYNQTAGTIVAKLILEQVTTPNGQWPFLLSDGSNSNRIGITNVANSGGWTMQTITGGVSQTLTQFAAAPSVQTLIKVGLRVDSVAGKLSGCANGGAITAVSGLTFPSTINQANFGCTLGGSFELGGWLQEWDYYNTALTDAQFQAVCT